jgi:hypothetical protein
LNFLKEEDCMKKAALLAPLVLLFIALVAYGCGGGSETTPATTSPAGGPTTHMTTTPAGGQTPTTSRPTATSPSSGGELSWDDVPIYPGADSIHKGSWSIPPTQEEYAEVEWRYFEVGAGKDDVAGYYESEMPDNGWDEIVNFDMAETRYFLYTKNSENDAAMVWVSSDDNKTVLALMRAAK